MTISSSRLTPLVVVFLISYFLLPCLAHVEMIMPPGINSKWDPQTLEANKDYSMTSPLFPDGSNFPCKGYNVATNYQKLNSVATLTAGQPFSVKLAGSATHNGGSCQWAVSYDQGKTFAVIASIVGGCPIGLNFDVPIPADLPTGKKATFSWTWFNFSGNREMYQNCAIVDVVGRAGVTSYTGPTLFRANTFADGTCITTENTEIVFPAPGAAVSYRGASNSSSPQTTIDNCSYNQDGIVTIYGDNYVPPASTTTSVAAPRTTTAPVAESSSATSTTTRSTIVLSSSITTPLSATASTSSATTLATSSPVVVPTTTEAAPTTTTSSRTVVTLVPSVGTTSTTTVSLTTSSSTVSVATATTTLRAPRTTTTTLRARRTPAASSASSSSVAGPRTTPLASFNVPPPTATTTPAAGSSTVTSSSIISTQAPTTTRPAATPSATVSTSASANDTYVRCETESTWSLCGGGACTFMGSVAPGTKCLNGAIVMARRRDRRGRIESAPATHQRMVVVRRKAPRLAH